MAEAQTPEGEEPQPVRVTDKRRLDPDSGEVRGAGAQVPAPGQGAGAQAPAPGQDVSDPIDQELADLITEPEPALDPAAQALAERTEDLRRLKAEYDNYRRRIERDREGWGQLAVAKVLGDLLPALDDVDRARAHDGLDGAFRAVADQLVAETQEGLS